MYYQFEGSKVKHEVESNKELFDLLATHDYRQVDADEIIVCERLFRKPGTYQEKKAALHEIAVIWQSDFPELVYGWGDALDWGDFFYEMGKKYGLLTEFKENGIPC